MKKFDIHKWRPELGAGGYANDDSNMAFYLRIHAILPKNAVILDLGAGRGPNLEMASKSQFRWKFMNLYEHCQHLIAADIDPIVTENMFAHETIVLKPNAPYPFKDNQFDIIISDWVLEHIDDISSFSSELYRILKPGGWFCARTPNKFGLIGLGVNFLGAFEHIILPWLQPERQTIDVFPKHHKLNTLSALSTAFKKDHWHNCTYRVSTQPAYHANKNWLFWATEKWQKFSPECMKTIILVFMQKKPSDNQQKIKN
ncbi:class I SAM-dependent methyltransferase [Thalassospira marina]|uniref:SAM-dependent methyltransferase n=1 Tax=Thalassospira marina TaxID=2048283 RepID=A0ABM6QDH4_9PROT|nr:class I SAM-dependent methyltransferase [Thalassospira marina]AUG54544.1 SAM-dependent methyltransferase [Thalassospira marina]